ncbi:MAG TPA: aminoglycoside phosphotransferase family protein [Mycobacteriales bacterium]|nr:aminoglycoside phosphotransferase family protein [Mycobacteriales bacterium]
MPPLIGTHALPDLLQAIAAEGRPVDLTGAALRSGWENVVVATDDGWIYRFPRDESVAFDRELATLVALRKRLPAAVPHVEWTGTRTRFAAYRALTGASFDRTGYLAATDRERDRLAASLAGFLAAMHSALSAAEIDELGFDHGAGDDPAGRIRSQLERIPAGFRAGVLELLSDYAATWGSGAVAGPTVLLHNDFHFGNLVLSEPVGEVVGVWDFSCVQLGVPSFDFRYFADQVDLVGRMARAYEKLTGIAIDLRAATIADRMERLGDAIETRDDVGRVISAWL